MDKAILVENKIDAGQRLVNMLVKKIKMPIEAAFWYFDYEFSRWSLILISQEIEKKGPIALYTKLLNTLNKIVGNEYLESSEIYLTDTKSNIYNEMCNRTRNSTVENMWLDNAYIYHINKQQKKKQVNKNNIYNK